MGYGYTSDKVNLNKMGFISKEKILEFFDERDIFALAFGYRPKENKYVVSPFREDNEPNCWFTISPTGHLRFVDFANNRIRHGIKMYNIDCFDAVRLFYNLPNFYKTLEFIAKNLKNKKKDTLPIARKVARQVIVKPVELYFEARNFVLDDKDFWSPFGIRKNHLLEDDVFGVSRLVMKNTKNGDVDILLRETCYALTGFEERVKFYYPYRKGHHRFITNCNENDIGSTDKLPPYGAQLLYTKAYKDSRVLRNQGRYSVWNQNEGMEPSDNILFPLVKRFDRVPILYDNDRTGIEAAQRLSKRINNEFPNKSRPVWIPEHLLEEGLKDPSDLRKRSKQELNDFLNVMRL